MNVKILEIDTVKTLFMGALSFFESNKTIPFDIRRIYYIYGVNEGVVRGGHAHKELSQLLFCPYGRIKITLDDGTQKMDVILDKPEKGLVISRGVWREMGWEIKDSVLCVAASDYYDENDYIREYDEFINLVEVGMWNE